jgi:hypothetical protein
MAAGDDNDQQNSGGEDGQAGAADRMNPSRGPRPGRLHPRAFLLWLL